MSIVNTPLTQLITTKNEARKHYHSPQLKSQITPEVGYRQDPCSEYLHSTLIKFPTALEQAATLQVKKEHQ